MLKFSRRNKKPNSNVRPNNKPLKPKFRRRRKRRQKKWKLNKPQQNRKH